MNNFKKFIILFLSIFIIVSIVSFSLIAWRRAKKDSSKYNISVLIQTGWQKEALKSMYLAELLQLSVDRPLNLYSFDLKKAKKKLKTSPFIKSVKIKKFKPNAIYIDYKIRKPLAWLYDLKNIAVDNKGNIFPMTPFFSPKNLPEIYLSEKFSFKKKIFWKKPLGSEKFVLALDVLNFLNLENDNNMNIKRIDVSNAFAKSYGRKEIVLIIEHRLPIVKNNNNFVLTFPRIIRLCVNDYKKQLQNYFSLNNQMLSDYKKQVECQNHIEKSTAFSGKVIDMRISKLAFIDL